MKRYITFLFIGPLLFVMFVAAVNAQTHWTRYEGNPVLNEGLAGNWDDYGVSWPFVIYDGAQFVMWYTGKPDIGYGNGQIGRATSPDGISWTKYEGNPVLTLGASGQWDDIRIDPGPVIFNESGYKMWYTGYDGTNWRIGLATSTDGIDWIKYEGNPILDIGDSGNWDDQGVLVSMVLFHELVYKMWYVGSDGAHFRVGYATSPDGIDWTKYSENPVLDVGSSGSWDTQDIEHAFVILNGDIYQTWYQGRDEDNHNRTGYATSPDGVTWTKYEENPVLDLGTMDWETQSAKVGSVILQENVYIMWYMARTGSVERIGYATAPVTINVPDQVETIQAAIDSAVDGNLVLVDEGPYYENINFMGKAITVASHYFIDGDTSHISKTIIDGSQHENPDSGSVVYFISGEDTNSVLCGFTITGGSGTYVFSPAPLSYNDWSSGGILVYFSGAKIEHNIIRNNHVNGTSATSGGIGVCSDVDDITIIRNNLITENTLKSPDFACGGGMSFWRSGTIICEKNTITKNNATSGTKSCWGGGICMDGAYGYMGNIYITQNRISSNEVSNTGTSYGVGGGIFMRNINPVITNNIISHNIAEYSGGGIFIKYNSNHLWPVTDPQIINNTITQNSTSFGGGISINGSQAHAEVENSILWNNSATSYPEIELYDGASVIVSYSNVAGGYTGTGNIDADPLFSDPLYHLGSGSPCIDTGNPSPTCNDFDGTRNDMGAYGAIADSLIKHITGLIENPDKNLIPQEYTLSQNYPNPFNPTTKIKFVLPKQENVKIELYNTLGQNVKTLLNKAMKAGYHEVDFNAVNLSSGIYFYRIEAGEFQDVKKMILLR